MTKNTTYLHLLVLLTIIFSFSHSQRTRTCPSNTTCKSLVECPKVLEYARSTDFSVRRKYRESICGFDRIVLVCCPVDTPTGGGGPPTLPVFFPGGGGGGNNTPKPPSGEDLLPKQCGKPSTEDRIHGGRPAPIGGYPWIVALGYTELGISGIKYECAGSLINNRYVLTAAHCLDQTALGNRRLSVINLGDWDLSTNRDCQEKERGIRCYPPHITAKPEQIIIHPSYSKRAEDSDDIALIRLDRVISFNSIDSAPIHPICLPSENLNPHRLADGRSSVAAGWGFTEHGNRSDILLRVQIPFAQEKLCTDFYGSRFVGNQLCLGGIGGHDTCSGDSGGPLVISGPRGPPFLQIGIVSFGALPCALDDVPAVYTNVADYVGWIKQNLRP